jgi:tetratricopeptide (TPR) repeat protein
LAIPLFPSALATPSNSAPKRLQILAIGCAIFLGTVGLFSRAVEAKFLNFDDDVYVTKNPRVASGLSWDNVRWACLTNHAANWHPLTWLSLQLDAQIFGLDPRAFHATNVMLHALSAWLLFSWLSRATGSVWPSAVASLLFAVHPLRVESVAWVAERKDVLSGLFFMLLLLAYRYYCSKPSLGRYLATAVCLLLGLAAKPMLVTAPFVLLFLDYWPLARIIRPGNPKTGILFEKLPLLGLALISGCLTLAAQRSGGAVSSLQTVPVLVRFANAGNAYAAYLGKWIWPESLAVFYAHPLRVGDTVQSVLAWILIAVMTLSAIWQRGRRPYVFVGWFWYLTMLLPVIGIVQVGLQAMADRYTYLPSIGISVGFVWLFAECFARWRLSAAWVFLVTVLMLGALSARTWHQLGFWRDSLTLWRHTIQTAPDHYLAHYNLGEALAEHGYEEEAADEYAKAVRLEPEFADGEANLGAVLLAQGELNQAISHLQRATSLDPAMRESRYNLARAWLRIGKTDRATGEYQALVAERPNDVDAVDELGYAFYLAGDRDAALRCFVKASMLAPRWARCLCEQAHIHYERGQKDLAAVLYRRAGALEPGWVETATQEAWVQATNPNTKRRDPALALYLARMASEATAPQKPELLDVLAAAYAASAQFVRAVEIEREALKGAERLSAITRQRMKQRLSRYEQGEPLSPSDIDR